MSWNDLPARALDQSELVSLVDQLAALTGLWSGELSFSAQQRQYVSLYRDQYVDVWAICWTRGSDTGWHDHDVSSGAVRVVRGSISESSPRIGGRHPVRAIRAGESFGFGPDHIHRLVGEERSSVTVHAYSPPLWRLGQYSISEDGLLRRISVSYAEELRPLDPADVG
jgi:hypothetical protein